MVAWSGECYALPQLRLLPASETSPRLAKTGIRPRAGSLRVEFRSLGMAPKALAERR
jgi:hypothetical protein